MMDAASPLWWQAFDAEREARRLDNAARALRGEPPLDTCGEQIALLAQDLLALAAVPMGELTARDWRVVQECATRLLNLARVAEASASRI
jgi:hypothetical protein